MNAIDTNVLVYLVDADEPAKQSQARALMDRLAADESDTVLLWQAAVEFLACLRRWESRGRISRGNALFHSVLVVSRQFSVSEGFPNFTMCVAVLREHAALRKTGGAGLEFTSHFSPTNTQAEDPCHEYADGD